MFSRCMGLQAPDFHARHIVSIHFIRGRGPPRRYLEPCSFRYSNSPSFEGIAKYHPRIHLLAYLDDVFLLGSSEDIWSAFHDLKNSFSALVLDFADHNCEIF